MNSIPGNIIRQVLLLLLTILLGAILFLQLKSFLPALLGAYTLYVMLRKWMLLLTDKYKWRKSLAAATLMLLSFVVFLLPIILVVNMMSSKIAFAVEHSAEVLQSIERYIHQYELSYNIQLLSDQNIDKLTDWISKTLPDILGATFNTITAVGIMYFILYFMLTEGRSMESGFYEWVPLKDDNILLLRKELNGMVFSNAIGIPLVAFLQGIVGLVGYFVLGVSEPMFWFVITCITAMLPIIGAAFAYVPLALLFFSRDETLKGVLMLIYGFGIIGTVDNLFRFWLQKRLGDVHPLITVFGVIAGINLFGFIGIIFGPILISLFLLLAKIYVNEFSVLRQRNGT